MSGVRPFRAGDWLRHVHWAQTAKHDRLIVRERQATGRRSVELVIDVDREAHPDAVETDSLEEVIRVARLDQPPVSCAPRERLRSFGR